MTRLNKQLKRVNDAFWQMYKASTPAELDDSLQTFKGAVWQVYKIGGPIGLSYTFSMFMAIAGRLIANYNKEDHETTEGASNLATAVTNNVLLMAISALFAIGIMVSQELGKLWRLQSRADDPNASMVLNVPQDAINIYDNSAALALQQKHRVASVLRNSLPVGLLGAAFAMLTIASAETWLVSVFKQDPEAAHIAQSFFDIVTFCAPAILWRCSSEQVMFAFKKQVPAMLVSLSSLSVGVTLSTLLCFGYAGLPELGLAGIAYGLLAESYLTAIGFGLYLALSPTFKGFHFYRNFNFQRSDLHQFLALLRISGPITLSLVSEVAASFIVNMIAGMLGKDELAVQYFASQLYLITIIPIYSLAQATTQEISRAVGSKLYRTANLTARAGVIASLAFIAPLCITAMIFPEVVVKMAADTDDLNQNVSDMVKYVVPIKAAEIILDAIRVSMLQSSKSAMDNIVPTLLSIGGTWAGALLAYLLAFYTETGIYGVAAGYAGGLAISCLALFPRWQQQLGEENLRIQMAANRPSENIGASCFGFFNRVKKSVSNMFCWGKASGNEADVLLIKQEEGKDNSLRLGYYGT